MKQLIFIDNDGLESAHRDANRVKNILESFCELSEERVESMKIVHDFTKLNKDEQLDLIFSKENIICSYSLYTTSHFGSLYQLMNILSIAGRNDVRDLVYIDGSGMMLEAIDKEILNVKPALDILQAIASNTILSWDNEDGGKIVKLNVDLKGKFESHFKKETLWSADFIKIFK